MTRKDGAASTGAAHGSSMGAKPGDSSAGIGTSRPKNSRFSQLFPRIVFGMRPGRTAPA